MFKTLMMGFSPKSTLPLLKSRFIISTVVHNMLFRRNNLELLRIVRNTYNNAALTNPLAPQKLYQSPAANTQSIQPESQSLLLQKITREMLFGNEASEKQLTGGKLTLECARFCRLANERLEIPFCEIQYKLPPSLPPPILAVRAPLATLQRYATCTRSLRPMEWLYNEQWLANLKYNN